MHSTLRYILTKATDLGAMLGVALRMSGNSGAMFRNRRQMSDSMSAMPGNIGAVSDNMDTLSDDLSAMPCDLYLMPDNIEAMSDNYARMSLVSLLRSLNPFILFCGMAAMLRYEISEWYYRQMGLSDPVLRKFYKEADFDDLFEVGYIDDDPFTYGRFHKKWKPMPPVVHELLYFLVSDKPLTRDARKLLAVLLAYARLVLGLTERTAVRTLPSLLAVQFGSGRSPLGPRPPPGVYV
jgi:hypothetical protein